MNNDMQTEETFFIKPGYKPNTASLTVDLYRDENYWQEWRIKEAEVFQFYVYRNVKSLLQKYNFKNILDIGSGPPIKLKSLVAPYCDDITLIDQASVQGIANQILPSAKFIPVDIEKTALDLSQKFGIIVCADVIEHLINPDSCLNLIKHHLKASGLLVISTPERDFLRGKDCDHSPKPEHVREWNQHEFSTYIKSRGFEIIEHQLFPQEKLNHLEYFISRLFSRIPVNRRWSSCQMVIGKLSSRD